MSEFGFHVVKNVLPAVVRHLMEQQDSWGRNCDQLHHRALDVLFKQLIGASTKADISACPTERPAVTKPLSDSCSDLPCLTPHEMGKLYEILRGFKLIIGKHGEPMLSPSRAGSRNQGLFYTPQKIVSHIVSRTLDALEITDPSSYLNLRILDPAVGTGFFLVEAMRQCVQRIVGDRPKKTGTVKNKLDSIAQVLESRLKGAGVKGPLDESLVLRIHLAEKCLYGVDLDPLAIEIARFALLQETFGSLPRLLSLELRLKVGNSLIGAARGERLYPVDQHLFTSGMFPEVPSSKRNSFDSNNLSKFHWFKEFPEVLGAAGSGFDAVIGNPPYEIVSAKESGIASRFIERTYYESEFKTCRGKINLYRLMLERALDLLRSDGALGFIVPATLLSDSTALPLRTLILDTSEIVEAVMIPEKARTFSHVTQALVILVCRKGRKTRAVTPTTWDGQGPIPRSGAIEVPRGLIERTGCRIPILRSHEEKKLLQALMAHPPLGGTIDIGPAGQIHQGEANLTVHREFLTTSRTEWPLIRGEHVAPFRVIHPAPSRNRLDWVLAGFFHSDLSGSQSSGRPFSKKSSARRRGAPWKQTRIVVARVVNMATHRRLKAAVVKPGCLLGDMTNFVVDLCVSEDYLVALLNSSLLNWRIKLTSSNNYLSSAELEALPVPRIDLRSHPGGCEELTDRRLMRLMERPRQSVAAYTEALSANLCDVAQERRAVLAAQMVAQLATILKVEAKNRVAPTSDDEALGKLLDALVFSIYAVDPTAAAKIFSD